jgi:hypothetical protein
MAAINILLTVQYNVLMAVDIAINRLFAGDIAIQYIVGGRYCDKYIDGPIQYSPTIPIYFRTFEDITLL